MRSAASRARRRRSARMTRPIRAPRKTIPAGTKRVVHTLNPLLAIGGSGRVSRGTYGVTLGDGERGMGFAAGLIARGEGSGVGGRGTSTRWIGRIRKGGTPFGGWCGE